MPLVPFDEALGILRSNRVIAFPTETFYGLGCNPFQETAVQTLLSFKERDEGAGVPVLIDTSQHLDEWIIDEPSEVKKRRVELQQKFWPGPLTLIISLNEGARKKFFPGILGPDDSLAVRISPSKIATQLASALAGAITATSANEKGKPPAKNPEGVARYFPDLPIVGSDELPAGDLPSTILDVRAATFRILREGAINSSDLNPFLV